jgi:hypothetical protein
MLCSSINCGNKAYLEYVQIVVQEVVDRTLSYRNSDVCFKIDGPLSN